MLDYVHSVTTESGHFNSALQPIWESGEAPSSFRVPSCPDWSAPDLAWHLGEVQYFWASIVEGSLTDPADVVPLTRPEDDQLLALHAREAERLASLLADRDAAQPCWSWDGGLQNVAWVRRRQAHEALIHRIDAELTADAAEGVDAAEPASIDEALAADGVDEMLRVMLDVGDGLPEWGTFESDGTTVRLRVPERSWRVLLGALTGTDSSGAEQQLPAIRVLADGEGKGEPAATLSCQASSLDLWLWRRSPLTDAVIEGDRGAVDRLNDIADLS